MRNHRRHSSPVESLRLAIDCMPVATREAMLEAVRAGERIITGAYVDGQGGVCPMLAAHRRGGRTDFISFARSWDRFTRAGGKKRAATPREVAVLVAQLEDSLLRVEGLELDLAIKEHRQLLARSKRARRVEARRRLPDSADPSGEIIARRLRRSPAGRFVGDNLARRSGRGSLSPVPSRG
jgi:hypothetical protein